MKLIKIKGLSIDDKAQLKELQDHPKNPFSLYDFIADDLDETESDYAFGLYENDTLVAHCSVGSADRIEHCLPDDELLADVFVHPEYRRNGYAEILVAYAINHNDHKTHNIYCEPSANMRGLYRALGFEPIYSYLFVHNKDGSRGARIR